MILGIGTDLANIDRIQGVLSRYGDRFRNRVFTETEQAKASRRKDEAGTYAKRWAAKEACSKALGTGLRMGIAWRDMSVTNLSSGNFPSSYSLRYILKSLSDNILSAIFSIVSFTTRLDIFFFIIYKYIIIQSGW